MSVGALGLGRPPALVDADPVRECATYGSPAPRYELLADERDEKDTVDAGGEFNGSGINAGSIFAPPLISRAGRVPGDCEAAAGDTDGVLLVGDPNDWKDGGFVRAAGGGRADWYRCGFAADTAVVIG